MIGGSGWTTVDEIDITDTHDSVSMSDGSWTSHEKNRSGKQALDSRRARLVAGKRRKQKRP